eukprot:8997039-Pyramimonas_sp.AAC.2
MACLGDALVSRQVSTLPTSAAEWAGDATCSTLAHLLTPYGESAVCNYDPLSNHGPTMIL